MINTRCKNIEAIIYNIYDDCILIYLTPTCNYTKKLDDYECKYIAENKITKININILTGSCISQCYPIFSRIKIIYFCAISFIILLSIYMYYKYNSKIYYYYYDATDSNSYICPICLDDIVPSEIYNNAVKISYCNCSSQKPPLHEKCISAWLKKKSICPICREQV